MLLATPCKVTLPSFTYTVVAVALTLRWNKSAVCTFILIQVSECSAGCSPLTTSWLSTLLTPGKLATVFSAMDLCDSSATVPVRVTTPSLESVLIESSLR